ncbi:MAG: ATP-binding cassette domain-containing protein [Egibacteraceae bacterium]
MNTVARLRGVSKRYGATVALQGVDLDVPAGQLLAVLGPNGAGKTTAVNLLCGLRRPDAGTVEVLGGDPRDAATRRHVGVTPQAAGTPEALTVREVVDYVRAHYPDPMATAEVLARFELETVAGRQTGGLSGGQRRRLAVALAFAGRPRLVLLDEPTTGLDVDARRALWRVVREELAAGRTILLTTHYLEEAEALADQVVVLTDGRIRAQGTVADIKASVELTRVRARIPELALAGLPGVVRAEADGERATLFTTDADDLVRHLVQSDVDFAGLEVAPVSLEEAFLVLTADREEVSA